MSIRTPALGGLAIATLATLGLLGTSIAAQAIPAPPPPEQSPALPLGELGEALNEGGLAPVPATDPAAEPTPEPALEPAPGEEPEWLLGIGAPTETVAMLDSSGGRTEVPVRSGFPHRQGFPPLPSWMLPANEYTPETLPAPEHAWEESELGTVPLPPEAAEALVPEGATPSPNPADVAALPEGFIMSPEVVIGEDRRVQVDSRTAPYQRQPFLLFRAGENLFRCSGSLVGLRTVITAAHCLHNADGWVSEMTAYFGLHQGVAQQVCRATQLAVPEAWVAEGRPTSQDWGIIQLDCRAGLRLGTMGYRTAGTAEVAGINWQVSGFPGSKPGRTQWTDSGPVHDHGPLLLRYFMSTSGGQSGGPVWRPESRWACGNCQIGVHTSGVSSPTTGLGIHNVGSRITAPVKAAIDHYRGR